ncbi:hypothetical protein C0Q70_13816 [Pomacea canaliculata]|uniref:Tetraspanin n=1 Tax=Pomacea canaliculata TaxID=400727 RepID=A0A2T7NY93_POMCA|nr:hypothetical protein C0Q70_13816 [Pomacea canaliculata]
MCISAAARVVLVVINIAIAIISLGVVVIGALLKFSADKFLQLVFGAASFSVQSSDKSDFNIPNIAQVSQLPFLGEVGYALIIFGAILFFVSFTACCGACCNYRVLLYIFIVVLTILVIAQAVVFALIMTKDSVFNKKIEDTIGDKVKSDFQANGQDVFSFSINLLNYLSPRPNLTFVVQLDCCGIRGQIDFSSLPPTCCLKSIIDGSDNARKNACVRSSAPPADYNTVVSGQPDGQRSTRETGMSSDSCKHVYNKKERRIFIVFTARASIRPSKKKEREREKMEGGDFDMGLETHPLVLTLGKHTADSTVQVRPHLTSRVSFVKVIVLW